MIRFFNFITDIFVKGFIWFERKTSENPFKVVIVKSKLLLIIELGISGNLIS